MATADLPSNENTSNSNKEKEQFITNEKQLKRLEDLIANVMSSRSELFKSILDPRRNVYEECGYPKTGSITVWDYQDLYDREALANRAVRVWAKESWQITPSVYETDDEKVTAFEEAWDALGASLRVEKSYHKSEEGSTVWEYLKRADILSGIGQYGVILLGLDDGEELSTPAKPRKDAKLLYLRCFPESLCQITSFEADPTNPRFGQPTAYLITLNDPKENQTGIGLTTSTVTVHWSRVIHIGDNLGSSEVFSPPRLRVIINNILGLMKLYCGSPEMYWKGAFPGWALSTNPQLGGDVTIDRAGLKDMMENYQNGLQRFIALMGMSATSLAPQVVDPTPQINTQIDAICIALEIPKRVFIGSERGELASYQDDSAWNDRLKERENGYITPRIIIPFVDRLINLGVLPEPDSGEYLVFWPDLSSQSAQDKATWAGTITTALVAFVSAKVEEAGIMTAKDFLSEVLGFTEEQATAMVEEAKKVAEEKAAKAKEEADKQAALNPPVPPQQLNQPPTNPQQQEATPLTDEQKQALNQLIENMKKEMKLAQNPQPPIPKNKTMWK